MARVGRDERAQQLLARWEALPVGRQGKLFLLMWANAMITVVLEPVTLVVALCAVRRAWQHRHVGLRPAMRAGASPLWPS